METRSITIAEPSFIFSMSVLAFGTYRANWPGDVHNKEFRSSLEMASPSFSITEEDAKDYKESASHDDGRTTILSSRPGYFSVVQIPPVGESASYGQSFILKPKKHIFENGVPATFTLNIMMAAPDIGDNTFNAYHYLFMNIHEYNGLEIGGQRLGLTYPPIGSHDLTKTWNVNLRPNQNTMLF